MLKIVMLESKIVMLESKLAKLAMLWSPVPSFKQLKRKKMYRHRGWLEKRDKSQYHRGPFLKTERATKHSLRRCGLKLLLVYEALSCN
jgi:hypothetical protein